MAEIGGFGSTDLRELETLPNIDINIKTGNSLISRFALDADLKKALKKNGHSIEVYKIAVQTYRNAENKEQKWEMQRLINVIKNGFEIEIGNYTDPRKVKLAKLGEELFLLTGKGKGGSFGMMMFEESGEYQNDKMRVKIQKIEKEIHKLNAELEDIKNNKIYENAFEWRFEFPDVLNDDGDYIGFDVIIGNPPYKLIQPNNTSDNELLLYKENYPIADFKIDLFHLFYQLGLFLSKDSGYISFITPSSILNNVYAEPLRNLLIKELNVVGISITKEKIFEDADVHTGIFQFQKNNNINDHSLKLTTNLTGVIDKTDSYRVVKQKDFTNLVGGVWNLMVDDSNISLIRKISNNTSLKDLANINRGLITGDRDKYFSNLKVNEQYIKILTGSDIHRYHIIEPNEFVLFERPKTAGGCWDKDVHLAPFKICIRQISTTPTATLIQQPFAVTGNIFTITHSSIKY